MRARGGAAAARGRVSPEPLLCESPPLLSSSRLSPSPWTPMTVAVEGGLAAGAHGATGKKRIKHRRSDGASAVCGGLGENAKRCWFCGEVRELYLGQIVA